jgi:hypothetical protein
MPQKIHRFDPGEGHYMYQISQHSKHMHENENERALGC